VSNASFARIMYGSNGSNGRTDGRGLLPFAPAMTSTSAAGSTPAKNTHGLEELLHRAWAVLSHKS
jgi:hypothetical protein